MVQAGSRGRKTLGVQGKKEEDLNEVEVALVRNNGNQTYSIWGCQILSKVMN